MGEDIECPYCGAGQDINHDDGYGYEEDCKHQQQCGVCDKNFTYTTSISFYYEAEKADCLNGSPHNYKPNKDPYGEWPDKKKCKDCGDIVQGIFVEGAYKKWLTKVKAAQENKGIIRRQRNLNHA